MPPAWEGCENCRVDTINITEEKLFIVCLLIFVISVRSFIKANRKSHAYKKYEFENRSSGGAVGFSSYEAGQKHEREKYRNNLMENIYLLTASSSIVGAIYCWHY